MSGTSPPHYARVVDRTGYRIWRGNRPLLTRFDIELTERCNNRCIHCCINLAEDDEAARRESSTVQLKSILADAAELGALMVRFTGGEPLLRDDFTELYLFARKLGLKVTIFTNARLITPAIADLLARVPPREDIEITVYGMTRESYETVSLVKGSYNEFMRGLELLADRKVPFVVKGVVLPQNASEAAELIKWAVKIPSMASPPNFVVTLDLRCRRDFPAKNGVIEKLRLPPSDVIAALSLDRERYLAEMKQFIRKFLSPPGDDLFSCGAGSRPCVDAYGRLQPCLMLRDPEMVYDLAKGTFRDAITDFFPKIRMKKAKNPEYLRRCARCFIKSLCGQCPARSYTENGTLDTPVDYLCRVAHARALDLGLLKDGEMAYEVNDWENRTKLFRLSRKV